VLGALRADRHQNGGGGSNVGDRGGDGGGGTGGSSGHQCDMKGKSC
jgi:hypothetical protein